MDPLSAAVDQDSLKQRDDVDHVRLETGQQIQEHVLARDLLLRAEANLRQPALQRHLAALETVLVGAARTGMLTLVAATGRLAQARADAATDAQTRLVRTGGRLNVIQTHDAYSSTRTR